MIKRYTTPEMAKIWNDNNKFSKYLVIELACLEAYASLGLIPQEDYLLIKNKATFTLEKIEDLELKTKHDVIAFIEAVSLSLGEEKKWLHYGLTSTDVVDSANSLLFQEANDLILKEIDKLLNLLRDKAHQYKNIPCIGRTHGIHAEIMSFGLKYALWYDELKRLKNHFLTARKEIEVVKLSGAVGNYANIPLEIEAIVGKALDLRTTAISTQVISRDRHAAYLFSLAQIAQIIEKIATEIRNLARSEIYEVSEYFSKGQKGSSAMPHKQNPVISENMCGCSRLMRAYLQVAMENNILWGERDISHSSNERIILSDAPTLLHYMLKRYYNVLENLVVRPERMERNINLNGRVIFSGQILNLLIKKGLSRTEAYELIQPLASQAMEENKDFYQLLCSSKVLNYLNPEELEACFTLNYYLNSTDKIYERVGI